MHPYIVQPNRWDNLPKKDDPQQKIGCMPGFRYPRSVSCVPGPLGFLLSLSEAPQPGLLLRTDGLLQGPSADADTPCRGWGW